jgi:hypothetical protein
MELKLSSTMHSGLTTALAFIQELRPCVWRKTTSYKLQSLTNLPLATRGRKRVALVVFSGLSTDPTAGKDVKSWHIIVTESCMFVAQRCRRCGRIYQISCMYVAQICRRCGRIYQINVSYSNKLQDVYSTGSAVTPSDVCYPYISFIVFCVFRSLYFWKAKSFYIIFVRMHEITIS